MSSSSHDSSSQINNPLANTVIALTADPNFTAVLAAAITNIIGNSHPNTTMANTHNSSVTATDNNDNGRVATNNNNNNNNGNGNDNNKVMNSTFSSN